jgi:hypothetical protein
LGISGTAGISSTFVRFQNDFFTVEVRVTNDLQYDLPAAYFLHFYHRHVLHITPVERDLQDDGMKVTLTTVFHPYIVCPAIIV